jgi:hypothetical protein
MLPKTPRIWQVTGAPLSNLRLAVAGLSMALPTSPHPVPDPLFPLRSSIAHHHEIERYIAAHEAGWKNRVLDVPVPEIVLQRAGIVPMDEELVTTAMPQLMRSSRRPPVCCP